MVTITDTRKLHGYSLYVCPEKLVVILLTIPANEHIFLTGHVWGLPDGLYRRLTPELLGWMISCVENAKSLRSETPRSDAYVSEVREQAAALGIQPTTDFQPPEKVVNEFQYLLEPDFWRVRPESDFDYWSMRTKTKTQV